MFMDKLPFAAVKLLNDFGIIAILYNFPSNCQGNYLSMIVYRIVE